MPIEKMYCSESRKSLGPQLLFEISLFKCHFISAIQYLYCYCDEYPLKQTAYTWSCVWNLHFLFLVCFSYFWKHKFVLILNLFISEYLDQTEDNEGEILSKPPDWKPLFLLKVKIPQNPACPNEVYLLYCL